MPRSRKLFCGFSDFTAFNLAALHHGLVTLHGPTACTDFGGLQASDTVRDDHAFMVSHFWPLLAAWWGQPLMAWPYERRLDWIRDRGLGLWDVYASCRRAGSLDSAIHDARPNDLAGLVAQLPQLALIAHNGGESARAMRLTRTLGVPVLQLPSTSPANASWSFERKRLTWHDAFRQAGLPA